MKTLEVTETHPLCTIYRGNSSSAGKVAEGN